MVQVIYAEIRVESVTRLVVNDENWRRNFVIRENRRLWGLRSRKDNRGRRKVNEKKKMG